MYVLLPPSESKAPGGDGPPLEPAVLGFPALNPLRTELIDQLATLCADPAKARPALGVSAHQDAQIAATATLRVSPTRPAMQRYTGVLYDQLDVAGLPSAGRARAAERLLITSALFGLVRGRDPIPTYRFSAGSRLPGHGPVAATWRPALTPVLAGLDDLVVDLRSGAYAAFAPAPGAVTVRVLSEAVPGDPTSRSVVSHFSKAAKGRLAHALVATRAAVEDVPGLLRVARRAGLRVERTGERAIDLVT